MRCRSCVTLFLVLASAGCRGGESASVEAAPARIQAAEPEAPSPALPHPVGPGDPLRKPMERDPVDYVGFSSDGSRFAYAALSEGAGYPILTVIDAETGRRVTDLPLDDRAAREGGRALLEEQGFVVGPRSLFNPLREDERLEAEVRDGAVMALLWKGQDRVVLEPGKPFSEAIRHFTSPSVEVWGFSPDGSHAAVRISQKVADQGASVTYWVFDLRPALEKLRARAD